MMKMAAIVCLASVSGPQSLMVWAIGGAAFGLYWFYRGFRLLQRKRLILNTPASKIRSASMGLVEISGLAAGPYVVTSPIGQTDCYYYRSSAWQLKQEGRNKKWVKVADETLHVPFYVDDNSAKVLVDPRGAEMDLHCDFQEQYNRSIFSSPGMPGSVAEFLTRNAVNTNQPTKVEEYCIKPKNFLFVLGTMSQNPGLDASVVPAWAERAGQRVIAPAYDDTNAIQQVVRLSDSSTVPTLQMTQQQKVAAALMKAGISNPAAWATAGVGVKKRIPPTPVETQTYAARSLGSAAAETIASTSEPEAFDLHPPVVLMKGSHDLAYFISWRSQRDVVKSLGWKSTLMIWGGPVLTVACLYFLLEHLSWL
jgi:hypothetical protein